VCGEGSFNNIIIICEVYYKRIVNLPQSFRYVCVAEVSSLKLYQGSKEKKNRKDEPFSVDVEAAS